MNRIRVLGVLGTFVLCWFISLPSHAWITDGIPICTEMGDQKSVQIVSDAHGGFIAVWQDQRAGNWDIYARRIDEIGRSVWGDGDLAVCMAAGDQFDPRAVTDGSGGIYVVWTDARSGQDIYGQRVFVDGTIQWAENGSVVCNAANFQVGARIVADGVGGAVTVWADSRTFSRDIYAQRFDETGSMAWTGNGIPVCTESYDQKFPELAILPHSDPGSIRVAIVWEDYRVSALSGSSIFAQRLTLSGVVQWASNGVPISTSPGNQTRPRVVSSFDGATIYIWEDDSQGQDLGDSRIYLEKLDKYGTVEWDDTWGPGFAPRVEPVPGGGMLIVHDLYDTAENKSVTSSQRFLGTGHIAPNWPASGVELYYSAGWINEGGGTRLASDGEGSFAACYYGWDSGRRTIRVRHVSWDADSYVWAPGAVFACRSAGDHWDPEIIMLEDDHLIVAWVDGRDIGTNGSDIYAQRLDFWNGAWGHSSPVVTEVADVAEDQGGRVILRFHGSDDDTEGTLNSPVTGYNIWRRVDSGAVTDILANARPARDDLSVFGDFNLVKVKDRLFAVSGAEKATGALPDGTWEVMGSFYAAQQREYAFEATTLADSSSTIPWSVFCVTAHTEAPTIWYASPPDSGYSVDNIAPGVPQGLSAAYTSDGVDLDWGNAPEADFQYYRVYRSTDPLFVPEPSDLIKETAVSEWTDPAASPWNFHYKITALDHAGNESEAGSPLQVTGVQNGTVPTRTTLLGAVPNPFNPSTKLSFEMASIGHARLKIYDAAGRLVVTLVNERRDAGLHEVIWDGRDHAGRVSSAGVYLYRLEVEDFVETKRMTLVK